MQIAAQNCLAQNLYRCEADGKTIYQQTPCSYGGKVIAPLAPPTVADEERAQIELAITRNQVRIGMNERHIVRSWGKPDAVNRTVTANSVSEQWVYRRGSAGAQYLYLENGILRSVQSPR